MGADSPEEKRRVRRPKPRAFWAEDAVNAAVERVWKEIGSDEPINRELAVRIFLGQPPDKGLVAGVMADSRRIIELKAQLFDLLMASYGDRLAAGLRLVADQRQRSQKGAAKRKDAGDKVAARIRQIADELRLAGKSERDIAGMVAKRVKRGPDRVRAVLKKKPT